MTTDSDHTFSIAENLLGQEFTRETPHAKGSSDLAFVWTGKGLLLHSDRRSQYASHGYQKVLREAGIVCSMSRKGNCWDNAPTESFFAMLKKELVHRKRRRSSLGYLSPEALEQSTKNNKISNHERRREPLNPMSTKTGEDQVRPSMIRIVIG